MKIISCRHKVFILAIFLFYASVVYSSDNSKTKSNVPEEISLLFSNKTQHSEPPLPTDWNKNGTKIYLEGGELTLKPLSHGIVKDVTAGKGSINQISLKSESSQQHMTADDKNISTSSIAQSGSKSVQKFNSTMFDFLSNTEDLTSNGTSSVKARKGVHFSKIVPKKGVNYDDFINYSLPLDHSCFIVDHNTCYDIDYYKHLECTCCNASNELGRLINHQPKINCSSCTPINKLPADLSQSCINICCENISLNTTENNQKPIIDKKSDTANSSSISDYQVYETQENSFNKFLNISEVKVSGSKNIIKKLKPSVTNVPYDSDVSNPFSKSKGEKYVPIIVSIFILPLAVVFIFFIWKKTREIWDRRYYKRMDFLIDGMYNE